MIAIETVFILGAGASALYGYPTGAGLKDMICDGLRDLIDLLIPRSESIGSSFEEDHKKALEENSVAFVEQFCSIPVPLIDRFLARNPDIVETGRTLVALCILYSEKNSVFVREIEKEKRKYDWYSQLFEMLAKNLNRADGYRDFKENKVDFITFNYDRSLEHFLYDQLKKNYRATIDLIKNKPTELIPFKFIHVYGKIDNFPWEDPPGLEYKSEYSVRDIVKVAQNIKLIHERDDEFFDEIKKTIAKAKNIFFLGFGYDEDNLRALGWPEAFNEKKRIFGTAFNVSEDRRTEIRKMIQKGFKIQDLQFNNPFIEPLDCRALLEKYTNSLYE